PKVRQPPAPPASASFREACCIHPAPASRARALALARALRFPYFLSYLDSEPNLHVHWHPHFRRKTSHASANPRSLESGMPAFCPFPSVPSPAHLCLPANAVLKPPAPASEQ